MISTLSMDFSLQADPQAPIHRILIVDDDCSLREFVAEALRDADYLVDTAANFAEAVEKLHDSHFDLLLTDYHMPRKTGVDLIHQMRTDGMEIPVIVMTGRIEELQAEHPDLQVSALLSKPFMLSELIDLTASVIRSIASAETLHTVPAGADSHRPSRRTVFF